MISFLAIDADNARLCCKCNINYVNIVVALVSAWNGFPSGIKFYPDVYTLLRGLDKETLTNVFLGESLADLTALLPEHLALFRYLCLPALHTLWT